MKVRNLLIQVTIIIIVAVIGSLLSEWHYNKEYKKLERAFPVITKVDTLNDKVINIDYP